MRTQVQNGGGEDNEGNIYVIIASFESGSWCD